MESASSSVLGQVVIRAAVLDRLVYNFEAILRDSLHILIGTAADYDEGVMFIRFMLSPMREKAAHVSFAHGGTDAIAQGIHRLIRCYESAPYIKSKIMSLYGAQIALTLMSRDNVNVQKSLSRGQEICELSNALSDISQSIAGKNVSVNVEYVKPPHHQFDPASEFVCFSVYETTQ